MKKLEKQLFAKTMPSITCARASQQVIVKVILTNDFFFRDNNQGRGAANNPVDTDAGS